MVPSPGLTRRQLLVGAGAAALGAALLAACGDDGDGGTASAVPTTMAPAAPVGTASITNKYGTYDVPLRPERLLLMENRVELEMATALGLAPMAVGHFFEFAGGPVPWVAPWVPFTPSGTEQVFKSFSTSTEHLLSLRPDLILSGSNWLDSDDPPYWAYPALSAVAPVVPLNLDQDWRADLARVAGWLQREERLAATLAEFDALRDEIKAKHADTLPTAKVAMGAAEPPALWLTDFAAGNPAARALQELGGQLMPFSTPATDGWLELSPESLGELDPADGVLVWAPGAEERNALTANPTWSNVPAVAGGRCVISEQNVGSGHLYTVMECMRLWDQVYATL